jgi:hypothetical protein
VPIGFKKKIIHNEAFIAYNKEGFINEKAATVLFEF